MLQTAAGLFCTHCQKSVLDLGEKDRDEIMHELSRHAVMPCVVVPTHVLDTPTYPQGFRVWTPFRKSAALIGLFLFFADVKAVLAQVKAKYLDADGYHIPPGLQRVEIKGSVKNHMGEPVRGAQITFSFLGDSITTAITDSSGNFVHILENYGGIRDVDLKISAEGHIAKQVKGFLITKPDPTITAILEKEAPFVIYGKKRDMVISGTVQNTSWYYDRPIRVPWGSFARDRPGYWATVVYTEKFVYKTRVLDNKGKPVPNARVEMKLPQNETRWGLTDTQGNLTLHIQLSEPALRGHITISAPGHRTRHVYLQEFKDNTRLTVHILKRI